MDGRKNNGGAREGAGRKPKADEIKVARLGTEAIIKEYGSEESFWVHIAKESKGDKYYMRMLLDYVYGKPKETKSVTVTPESGIVDMSLWK